MQTYSYQISLPSFSGGWGFTIAQKGIRPPQEYLIPEGKTRFLTSEVMTKAGIFGKDERATHTIINSIFKPQLYLTYNKDVSLW
jgi:predicted membrane-bound spermidine synthase